MDDEKGLASGFGGRGWRGDRPRSPLRLDLVGVGLGRGRVYEFFAFSRFFRGDGCCEIGCCRLRRRGFFGGAAGLLLGESDRSGSFGFMLWIIRFFADHDGEDDAQNFDHSCYQSDLARLSFGAF